MPKQLSKLALKQLWAWQALAMEWHINVVYRKTESGHLLGAGVSQYHLACVTCGGTITVLMSGSMPYLLTNQMILDDITRHVRNVHRDLEDDVYGRQDPTPAIGS